MHRIESRNAFIACVHNHESGDPVVFLICEKCGAVGEAASAAVADTIKSASRAAGFTPKTPVIEISGVCAHCKSGVSKGRAARREFCCPLARKGRAEASVLHANHLTHDSRLAGMRPMRG